MKRLAAALVLAACRSTGTAPVAATPTPVSASPGDAGATAGRVAPVAATPVAATPTPAPAPAGDAGATEGRVAPPFDRHQHAPNHGVLGSTVDMPGSAFALFSDGPVWNGGIWTLGAAIVKGRYDHKLVRRTVQRVQQELEGCLGWQLLASNGLGETVTVRFTIGAGGNVTAVSATGVDANVETCIATTIETLTFAKPAKGQLKIEIPITFTPG